MLSKAGSYLRRHHLALIALFVALGGTAYATATVGSGDVIDNSLKSIDLKNGKAVKGADVVNNSLTGAGINESTLHGIRAGVFSARLVDLGGNGTVFGAPMGTGGVNASSTPVELNMPSNGPVEDQQVENLHVFLPDGALGSGQSRTFTVLVANVPELSCMINQTSSSCNDSGPVIVTPAAAVVIKVDSSGTPSTTADALVAFEFVD